MNKCMNCGKNTVSYELNLESDTVAVLHGSCENCYALNTKRFFLKQTTVTLFDIETGEETVKIIKDIE